MLNVKLLGLFCLLTLSLNTVAADAAAPSTLQQDLQADIKKLEASYAQNPNNSSLVNELAKAYNNQGVLLAQQQDWAKAEQFLQKALSLAPNALSFKTNLSSVYTQHGIDLYQNKNDPIYSSYSHTEAKQLANLALSLNPKNVNAYILLGDIAYYNQDMDGAQAAWQQAAQLVPTNKPVQDRLAKITREAQSEAAMDTKDDMYFIIKIDPDVAHLPDFDVNQALYNARNAVDTDFKYSPTAKVPVIVYTADQYHKTIPDSPDWAGGDFDGKIRVILTHAKNNVTELKSAIVHEYTHAVIADLSKNHCPRWINEGIAKYEEYKHGMVPRINYLATAQLNNSLIAWDKIDESIISPNVNEAMLAYQQVFSFVFYLVDKYGMDNLVTMFSNLATNHDFNAVIQQAYNKPLASLQSDWLAWLGPYIQAWSEAPVISSS